jgi:hypothetical protein
MRFLPDERLYRRTAHSYYGLFNREFDGILEERHGITSEST